MSQKILGPALVMLPPPPPVKIQKSLAQGKYTSSKFSSSLLISEGS